MDTALLIAALVLAVAVVLTGYRWLSLRTGVKVLLRVKEEREARELAERAAAALENRVGALEDELRQSRKEVVRLEEQRLVRDAADRYLPADGKVLVVSRGDQQLLELGGRDAEHFPQADGGVYAGHYPATGAGAIDHLEELHARGARFLVFPSTALWWLDHYDDLRRHLESHCRVVTRSDDACAIFDLDARDSAAARVSPGIRRD
jgi:hypothetical protein